MSSKGRFHMNNVGNFDRAIRVLIGATLILLVFIGPKTAWGWIGLLPLVSAIIGYCPVYTVLGTNHSNNNNHSH